MSHLFVYCESPVIVMYHRCSCVRYLNHVKLTVLSKRKNCIFCFTVFTIHRQETVCTALLFICSSWHIHITASCSSQDGYIILEWNNTQTQSFIFSWFYGCTLLTFYIHSVFINSHALHFLSQKQSNVFFSRMIVSGLYVTTAAAIQMPFPEPVVLCAVASVDSSLVVSM